MQVKVTKTDVITFVKCWDKSQKDGRLSVSEDLGLTAEARQSGRAFMNNKNSKRLH